LGKSLHQANAKAVRFSLVRDDDLLFEKRFTISFKFPNLFVKEAFKYLKSKKKNALKSKLEK
jgi:hypothetical protein